MCPVSFTSSVPFFSCPLSNDLMLLHHASSCVRGFLLVSHYWTMLTMEFVFGLNKGLALHRLSLAPVSWIWVHSSTGQWHHWLICWFMQMANSIASIMLLHDALHGYLQIFTSQYFICGADHDRETLLFSFMRLAITVFPCIIKQLEKRHINKTIVIYKLGIWLHLGVVTSYSARCCREMGWCVWFTQYLVSALAGWMVWTQATGVWE